MVEKKYLCRFSDMRRYLAALNSKGEERNFLFSQFGRNTGIAYLRIVDDEERRGVSLIGVVAKKFPGKKPFFGHEPTAYIFYDKKTKKLRTKNHKTILNEILRREALEYPIMKPFLPLSSTVESIKKFEIVVRRDEVRYAPTVFRWKWKYEAYQSKETRGPGEHFVDFNMTDLDVIKYVGMIMSSKTVLKYILSGRITSLKQAVKYRFNFPSGKINHKEAVILHAAFGGQGLKFLPYLTDEIQSLVWLAEWILESERDRYQENEGQRIPHRYTRDHGPYKYYKDFRDLVSMAHDLNYKINFRWSPARMKEEHDYLQKLITAYKLKSQPLKKLNYMFQAPPHTRMRILQTSHEFVVEGTEMHHCVGASDHYYNSAAERRAFIMSYQLLDERATAEVRVELIEKQPVLKVRQLQGVGNSTPSEPLRQSFNGDLEYLKQTSFMYNFLPKEDQLKLLGGGLGSEDDVVYVEPENVDSYEDVFPF